MAIERMGTEQEHCTDPLDRAGQQAEALNEEAQYLHRQRARASNILPDPDPAGACVDCEEPVEEQRVALGLGRCIDCARKFEALQRNRGPR
jgi:RNA polymerase-binding transcription factor DksA